MKQSLSLLSVVVLLLASCTPPFKKSPDGSEYKVFSNSDGKKAQPGNIMQMNISAKYKDSVLFSTEDAGSPRFIPFDTAQMPVFLKQVREGDSVVIRISTDTLIKKNQGAPFMKKGQFVYQYFKIVKLFTTREAADSVAKTFEPIAKEKAFKKQLERVEKLLADEAPQVKKDQATIEAYLKAKNLTATKTKWGTYIVIEKPGTGAQLTKNDIASVNYTGRNLKDSAFDSSTDPRFGHVEPYDVQISAFNVIPGWIDGLLQLQKGSVAKFIIPSTLAYGKAKQNEKIGENEILVFDIEVADVLTQEQMEAKMQKMQEEMMAKQKEAYEKKQQSQGKNGAADAPKTAPVENK